jgi:endonuclease/exonuclease/phosphatase family metal-dependent hydrolase
MITGSLEITMAHFTKTLSRLQSIIRFVSAWMRPVLAVFILTAISPAFSAQASPTAQQSPTATTFTVVTYNVENLFDVDGVAMFDDYKIAAEPDPKGYTRRKFQTKLEGIAKVLKTINEGDGPEVILFQELEADFTPESTVTDLDAFLRKHSGQTVATMLGDEWSAEYAGYSSAEWLLKALSDAGLHGYEIATVPSRGMDSGLAHTNAIFSKFPLRKVERHPLVRARDILEAELDAHGHPLYVYVNHWKSGASNPKTEPIRVENAKVLRRLLDARLTADPQADIIIAGDLNAHYNYSDLNPNIETGINDVLGSSGAEDFSQSDLYNLWFELPSELRFSEVWRGHRGTLMHMLLTSGLYDDSGISYVDGSFAKLIVPGFNADAIGRPYRWSSAGEAGSGVSDHAPIYAKFSVGPFAARSELSRGDEAPDLDRRLDVSDYLRTLDLPDGNFLSELDDAQLAPHLARLFVVDATVLSIRPARIQVGERVWPAFYTHPNMIAADGLPAYQAKHGGKVRLVVQPNFYRGTSQLMVESILGEW